MSSDEAVEAAAQGLTLFARSGRWVDPRPTLVTLAATVRAEAVADERRRIAPTLSEIAEMYLYNGDSDRPLNDGYGTLLALADSLAAGSVPVATPPAEPAAPVHDANCEQQLGACCCHCQKRSDVAFSHAAPSQPWSDPDHDVAGDMRRVMAAPIDLLTSLRASVEQARGKDEPESCGATLVERCKPGMADWPGPCHIHGPGSSA